MRRPIGVSALCLVATMLCMVKPFGARSDERNQQAAGSSPAAGDSLAPLRWYSDLAEAKQAANRSGRPIMVVFR